MYDDLVKRCKALDDYNGLLSDEMILAAFDCVREAADAIEELTLTAEKVAEYFKRWVPASKRLPEEPGEYEVYIKDPFFKKDESVDDDFLQIDTSYVTTACYDPNTGLWKEYVDSYYNAHLECVDTNKAYHITHWRPLPEPPKEGET